MRKYIDNTFIWYINDCEIFYINTYLAQIIIFLIIDNAQYNVIYGKVIIIWICIYNIIVFLRKIELNMKLYY